MLVEMRAVISATDIEALKSFILIHRLLELLSVAARGISGAAGGEYLSVSVN